MRACKSGDVAEAMQLCEAGVDVNATDAVSVCTRKILIMLRTRMCLSNLSGTVSIVAMYS